MSVFGGGKAAQAGLISVLDIGSSKICCIIAKMQPCEESAMLPGRTHKARVAGIGHQRSRGIKSGVVVDLEKAEQSIRLAVDAAERMAGVTIESLIVNTSAGRLKSSIFASDIDLSGQEVSQSDINRVLAAGAKQVMGAERQVIHALPVGYMLDGERGIRDPMGMIGDQLGVEMHVLTADAAPLRNTELCINRSHLSIEALVATPYASGLAALVEVQREGL